MTRGNASRKDKSVQAVECTQPMSGDAKGRGANNAKLPTGSTLHAQLVKQLT